MTLLFCVVFFGYLQYMFIFGFSIWNKFLGKEKQKGQLKGYLCVKCEFTFIDSWMINSYSDDKELQCSLRRGTISAFVYIYTTYYDALLNYADRLLNDVETARDVVQQVYYKIWEGRAALAITLSVKAYLFKSVYYRSLNTLAHKKNIQKYEQEHSADVYYSTVIQLPEAEVLLRRSDIEKAVWEVVATLPEKCREVFTLSKIDGLKNREIAEKLIISEKTVKRHISIALSRLRERLDYLLQIILFFLISYWD